MSSSRNPIEKTSLRIILGVSRSFRESSEAAAEYADCAADAPFSEAPYPAFSTASIISLGSAFPSTPMEFVSRLTEQLSTPFTFFTAFSTRALHAAQLIPVTLYCFIFSPSRLFVLYKSAKPENAALRYPFSGSAFRPAFVRLFIRFFVRCFHPAFVRCFYPAFVRCFYLAFVRLFHPVFRLAFHPALLLALANWYYTASEIFFQPRTEHYPKSFSAAGQNIFPLRFYYSARRRFLFSAVIRNISTGIPKMFLFP